METPDEARPRRDVRPPLRLLYRFFTGLLGALVLMIGIVLIPYPGPGWLIVFAGLAILASEFAWARRLLNYGRAYYDRWMAWLGRQPLWVRVLAGLGTAAVVLVTLWLFNTFGLLAGWLGLDQMWLRSPLF